MPNHADATYQYPKLKVDSPNLKYSQDELGRGQLESLYEYEHVRVERLPEQQAVKATPMKTQIAFRTQLAVPKLGVMLVGWGGNNGTTVTGAVIANKLKMHFDTKDGRVHANYFGSVTQASTVYLGAGSPDSGSEDFYVPMRDLLPMVDPNEFVIDGWDISSMNLADAMQRAKVLDVQLQQQLRPHMQQMVPRKALFDINFVAANQSVRADNVLDSSKLTKWEQVQQIMADIEDFKSKNSLDKVIVLWTANTERFCELLEGVHDTADNLIQTLQTNAPGCAEVSPSSLYALACILSGVTYINGSPQNTFVPALIELAEQRGVFIAGDDFKSGQTKFKSVLVDFLVNAGIKPCSIVSYNHLGNNDGYNLSSPLQFRSKEISKSSVVDDMVASNKLLFGRQNELAHPDHCVVIKYVPHVGDSKRALDEYVSELMLGGKNTIVSHNTCEDSLLASPLIIDLILIAELCERIRFRIIHPQDPQQASSQQDVEAEFQKFNSVLSVLAYLCKAPLVERGAKVVNALFRQRACIENLMRALLSLPAINHLDFEHKLSRRELWYEQVSKVESIERLPAESKQQAANVVDIVASQSSATAKLAELQERAPGAVPMSASGY